jgi:hypothetical protein
LPARLRALAAVAVLLSTVACRTGPPYKAPAAEGAPSLGSDAAAKLVVLVVADADPRVNPPWIEKAEKAADAVAAALAQAGFRTTRQPGFRRTPVRVTVTPPLRGPDFTVAVDANGKEVDRWPVNGAAWGPEELAELGRAVRERLERSGAIAALAGVTAPASTASKAEPSASAAEGAVRAQPAAPPAGKRRLAVLDFRGAVPGQVLAILADQARAAAAEAGRTSETTVMTRESVLASNEKRRAEPCADVACDLETARAAGADLVVTGEVSAIGDARFLVLRLVDTASGVLVASRHAQAKDDLALVEAARPAAAALFQ